MYRLLHDPSVCVFMYGQATESRWTWSRIHIIWFWPINTLYNQSGLVVPLLSSPLPEQYEQEYNTRTDEDEFTDLPDLVPLSDEDDVEEEECEIVN